MTQVQVGNHHASLQAHDGLDETSDAGRCLQVSQVGFDRTDAQLVFAGAPENLRQGGQLDGITQRRAGAVGLHVVHIAGRQSRVVQRLADDRLLGGAVGNGQPAGAAVVRNRRAQHQRVYGPPFRRGAAHARQHHHARTLRTNEAVGTGIEGLAAAVGRQHARARVADGDGRIEHDVGAARDGQLALPAP